MITSKMKSRRTQILALILAGLIAQLVTAEVIPGRWEKVVALETASPITVNLKNGDRIKGQFRGLSPSDLELLSPAGWAAIPKADLLAMATREQGGVDIGARKGAISGAAAGAGIGNADQRAARANRDGGDDEGETARLVLLIVSAIAVGIGTGLCIVAGGPTKGEAIVIDKTPEAS